MVKCIKCGYEDPEPSSSNYLSGFYYCKWCFRKYGYAKLSEEALKKKLESTIFYNT